MGINTADWLRTARAAADATAEAPLRQLQNDGPQLVEADPDKIVYVIIVDLPDAGLLP